MGINSHKKEAFTLESFTKAYITLSLSMFFWLGSNPCFLFPSTIFQALQFPCSQFGSLNPVEDDWDAVRQCSTHRQGENEIWNPQRPCCCFTAKADSCPRHKRILSSGLVLKWKYKQILILSRPSHWKKLRACTGWTTQLFPLENLHLYLSTSPQSYFVD